MKVLYYSFFSLFFILSAMTILKIVKEEPKLQVAAIYAASVISLSLAYVTAKK